MFILRVNHTYWVIIILTTNGTIFHLLSLAHGQSHGEVVYGAFAEIAKLTWRHWFIHTLRTYLVRVSMSEPPTSVVQQEFCLYLQVV